MHKSDSKLELCLIKKATQIPCPSCGTTRSVYQLINGEFLNAILINPFGIIVFTIMLVLPFWILIDVFLKKDTLWRFYNYTEKKLKESKIYIPLILLVVLNWIWNIYKGL